MLLLHISDIHFREPQCLRPATDPDRVYRTRMIHDLRVEIAKLGEPVGAILIGGDIAFKAHPVEYGAAEIWIKELAETTGCPFERVYVIPGNHDVDRGIIAKTPSVKNVQAAIINAADNRREAVLREQFEDAEAADALLRPHAAYNDFAKIFSCQVYSPEHLYWKQDLDLEHGVRLRLNGLTSTLLSGRNGGANERMGLYLSPLQTALDPEEDVVNLVIAHHPPDWCMDHDQIEACIADRAAIHLFGHKHTQRVTLTDNYVRIGAAGVNPDRDEAGFDPGYNLIDVHVSGEGEGRSLDITAHLRHWQTNPEGYQSRMNGNQPVYRKSIPIPALPPRIGAVQNSPVMAELVVIEAEPVTLPDAVDTEAAMSDETTRNLVYRFWKLTSSQRRDIAADLGLLEEEEMALLEPERYGRALLRAGERGLVDALGAEIKKRERA